MNIKKTKFVTDGTSIYKVEKYIKAAILTELLTAKEQTAEIVKGEILGFVVLELPEVNKKVKIKNQKEKTPIVSQAKQDTVVKKKRKGKTSEWFGVGLNKKSGKWRTSLWINEKNVSVGEFDDEILAARAVDAKLVEAGLSKKNFPLN